MADLLNTAEQALYVDRLQHLTPLPRFYLAGVLELCDGDPDMMVALFEAFAPTSSYPSLPLLRQMLRKPAVKNT